MSEPRRAERFQSDSEPEIDELWRRRGRTVPVFGHDVFCVEAGPPDGEPLLVLHGFPTSSLDFHRALPTLAERYRVVLHDHPGFGFSSKPERYSYSLIEQAEVALGLWRQLGIRSGHIVAHDYGTSIATEILARRLRTSLPIELRSVSLCNGSVFLELARLRWSQRLARSNLIGPLFTRLISKGYFKRALRRLWGDPRRASDADLEAIWRGLVRDGGRSRMPEVSSYLDERTRFLERWTEPLRKLDLPALVLWGRRDPVAVAAIAERLAAEIPNSTLRWLDDLGHFPMLEDPEEWSAVLLAFLASTSSRR